MELLYCQANSTKFYEIIMFKHLMISLAVILGFTSTANAAIMYDESVNGDLSDDNLAPTQLGSAELGSNIVKGSTDNDPLEPDFWSLTIDPGYLLSAIILNEYSNEDDASFFAVSQGDQITSITDGSDLLGITLFGAADGTLVGQDLLDDLATATTIRGVTVDGFTAPLGAGTYTFWTQETAGVTTYEFDFQVTAVPKPLTILGAGVAVAFGTGFKRKLSKAHKK